MEPSQSILSLPPGAPLSASDRLAAEPKLGRTLKISLIAHLAFVALVVIKSLIFPSKPMSFIPTLRVDLVGLPDILKKDKSSLSKLTEPAELNKALKEAERIAKQMKPVAPVKAPKEVAAPDEMVLKPKSMAQTKERKKKLQSALDRIKALNKISESEDTPKATLVKGNQVSKGTSLSGDAREAAEASYFDLLRDKLQENWSLPVWIARQNLSAQIQIYIDGRGRLRNLRFIKVSGNPQFDEAVKRTVSDSQPYPVPPHELAEGLMIDGILVGFPL